MAYQHLRRQQKNLTDNVSIPYIQLYCLKKMATSITHHINAPNGRGLQLTAHLMSAMQLYSVTDPNKMLWQLFDKLSGIESQALMTTNGARGSSADTRGLRARSASLVKNVMTWVLGSPV